MSTCKPGSDSLIIVDVKHKITIKADCDSNEED